MFEITKGEEDRLSSNCMLGGLRPYIWFRIGGRTRHSWENQLWGETVLLYTRERRCPCMLLHAFGTRSIATFYSRVVTCLWPPRTLRRRGCTPRICRPNLRRRRRAARGLLDVLRRSRTVVGDSQRMFKHHAGGREGQPYAVVREEKLWTNHCSAVNEQMNQIFGRPPASSRGRPVV